MPTPYLTPEETARTIDAIEDALKAGHRPIGATGRGTSAIQMAAMALNIPRTTMASRVRRMAEQGVKPDWSLWVPKPPSVRADADNPFEAEALRLTAEVRTLRAALNESHQAEMTREAVRKHILGIADADPAPPTWTTKLPNSKHVIGVPTLFCSDWHWGEVVNASEVAHSNEFNMEIAHTRVRKLIDTTLDLLFNRLNTPEYPGIVLLLGGDMVTGTIHDELTATNDKPIGPTVLDLYGVLVWMIGILADKFGKVFIVGVAGNHGRLTRKPVTKERAHTNWDWLLYQFLERHFTTDNRTQFHIPNASDAHFQIYGHKYLLTHGDQFRGGDGITGGLMPIVRGRHKKASRDSALSGGWDTIVMGHWHTLMQMPHIIVNGALKGYDEYAYQHNFEWERAAQALWVTHPEHGIAYQLPIYVDDKKPRKGEWVQWGK